MELRPLTEADKSAKSIRVKLHDQKTPTDAVWNSDWKCWALAKRPHILVSVAGAVVKKAKGE